MAEARGKRLRERISPLAVIAPVILIAAVVLGGYSFRYASQLAKNSESSLIESNRVIGEQTRERIDDTIIASDRTMFGLVDLNHVADFAKSWSYIVRVSPAVEAAFILDENQAELPNAYVSARKKIADAKAFENLFLKKILPDLKLDELKADDHKHLHKEYNGRDYLISYTRKDHEGHTYYLILKISIEYLLQDVFPDAIEPLAGNSLYCVRDDHGRVVFGSPVGQPGKFLFQKTFPTTLYMWRLQIAPAPAGLLLNEESARRRSEYLLITLTLGIVLAGTVFLLYVNQRENPYQSKSDFISNVSHELKTPLSLIRMFGEMIALGKLKSPDKAKEYADIITRESERLTRLIDNVLDFSRMERGSAAYEFQVGQLGEVVERSLDVYRHRAEREGFKLVTKIDPDLPPALIDENAMTLLLLNLLENAVKYGRGEMSVYLGQVGERLRLVVSDQGPGIPRDEQRRIFDRFYRTREARGTNVRGSGIGLALVKHIAEAHGGSVWVESEPGRGAAFIVDVPLSARREAA